MNIGLKRKLDRERKRAERAANTPYAQRVRESKRTEARKARRRELRQRPESKEKERQYNANRRSTHPGAKEQQRAHSILRWAVQSGKIKVPDSCELCGSPHVRLRDGRRGLRADHCEGYAKPLVVRFVCVKCDGEQERQRGNTTLGKRLAVDEPMVSSNL